MAEQLLCFGGPMNGQLISVERTPMVVAIPPRFDDVSFAAAEFFDVIAMPEPIREVRYDAKKVFLHDTTLCRHYPAEHGEWCRIPGPLPRSRRLPEAPHHRRHHCSRRAHGNRPVHPLDWGMTRLPTELHCKRCDCGAFEGAWTPDMAQDREEHDTARSTPDPS